MRHINTAILFNLIQELSVDVTYSSIVNELDKHPSPDSLQAISDLLNNWRMPNQIQHLSAPYLTDVLRNWNYRKLTIVSVLITAAKILDRPSLVRLARQIILETKNRQGLSMGLKAIADDTHVLSRLYHQTNFPELKIKIIQSIDLFLQQYVLSSGFSDPGIQNGWAGIGLILLATISSVEPTWDKMFLLSDY